MKKKCEKCSGKGGWVKMTGFLLREVFLSCPECLGKGSWWTNNRRREKKGKR